AVGAGRAVRDRGVGRAAAAAAVVVATAGGRDEERGEEEGGREAVEHARRFTVNPPRRASRNRPGRQGTKTGGGLRMVGRSGGPDLPPLPVVFPPPLPGGRLGMRSSDALTGRSRLGVTLTVRWRNPLRRNSSAIASSPRSSSCSNGVLPIRSPARKTSAPAGSEEIVSLTRGIAARRGPASGVRTGAVASTACGGDDGSDPAGGDDGSDPAGGDDGSDPAGAPADAGSG